MPARILVLEPDPERQLAFRAALASAGYVPITVSDAAEAIEQLASGSFDVALIGPGGQADAVREAPNAPPVVKLAILPDCVIGEHVGRPGQRTAELPGILEALTRYLRFAPPRTDGSNAEHLLQDWAKYERE